MADGVRVPAYGSASLADLLLSVRSVDLRFGGTPALRNVSVDVPRASVIALIGPNGAGKSSLLNCISGFYHPTAGSIVFDGEDVSRVRPHKRARRGIARTFQNIELVEEMTVLDNLLVGRDHLMRFGVTASAFGLRRARRGEDEHRRRVEDVIEYLGPETRALLRDAQDWLAQYNGQVGRWA